MELVRFTLFILCLWTIVVLITILTPNSEKIENRNTSRKCPEASQHPQTIVWKNDSSFQIYNRSSPLIFIGGFPRSGTTLVRSMLDVHSDINCGMETRVIPRILGLLDKWETSRLEPRRLRNAKITKDILRDAVAAFILEIIVKHKEPANRICNKDPFSLKHGLLILDLFPNAKFIFMIRDGRAVVESKISRNVTITGYNLMDYNDCLTKWSQHIRYLAQQCNIMGKERCLYVKYEELVINPRSQIERILKYLSVPWERAVLHHEDWINKPGGVFLSKMEKSTDQVQKAVNTNALSKWVGKIPDNLVENMDKVAPMLRILGYDPWANPPDYRKAGPVLSEELFDDEKVNTTSISAD